MKEHDAKPDKGGNRGSNQGHGKMGSAHDGFGAGHVSRGHKKLQTVPLLTKQSTTAVKNDSLKTTAK